MPESSTRSLIAMLMVSFLIHGALLVGLEIRSKDDPSPATERPIVRMVQLAEPEAAMEPASPFQSPAPPASSLPFPTKKSSADSAPSSRSKPVEENNTASPPSPLDPVQPSAPAQESSPGQDIPDPLPLAASGSADPALSETPVSPPFGGADPHAALLDDYEARLSAWLESHMVYPLSAQRRRMEGRVVLWVRIDPKGAVLDFGVSKNGPYPVLDEAALAMVNRARPFPPLPEHFSEREFTFEVPVHFSLR